MLNDRKIHVVQEIIEQMLRLEMLSACVRATMMTGKLRQMEQEGRVFDVASVQADFSWHLSLIALKDNDEIQLLVTSVELQCCLKTKTL